MRARCFWRGVLGALALAILAAPAGAQAVGSEFQVNTYTTSQQRTFGGNLIAADASGNFVVVWSSLNQDGSGDGVFGQRFDSKGVAQGDEFRINSRTGSHQRFPSVAAAADGGFVVVWAGAGRDDSYGVFGRRYDRAGGAQGGEFLVNSYTTSAQKNPSVASDESGNFVVVWSGKIGILAQRYDSSGEALGTEFQVNSSTFGPQSFPSVASDPSGNFVVAWSSNGDILGQRYDSVGEALGTEFQVNSGPAQQHFPSVASDASGNFVVVWTSAQQQDGSYRGIFGQRFDNAGLPLGSEFQVNSYTTSFQGGANVAAATDGGFVVVWSSLTQDGSGYGVFGQRYDSAGATRGGEFQINSFTTGTQRDPSVRYAGTNQFVVAWESSAQDGSGFGVFGRRFNFGSVTGESPMNRRP